VKRFLAACVIASCVPSQQELRAPVETAIAAPHIDVSAALAKPVDTEAAVAIALANSPRLAAAMDELGIAGGDLASALGLGATNVDVQLRFGTGHEYEVDAVQNVLGLVAMPRRRAAARAELAAVQAEAAATALRLAARVRIAFGNLLAAQQEVELRQTAFDAADTAATVRERMHAAGNTSDLAQARDRDAREQARIDLARAQAAVEQHRERVNALLGLSGERTKWIPSGSLRDLPPAPPMLDDLEHTAAAASLDLAAGRARSTAAANRAGAATLSAFLPELGVGVSALDRDGNVEVGPALRLGIPLFDQRAGERARATAALAKRQHELEAAAVELRAEARAARITALAAYEEARHLHDIVLPLRQQIVDETLLHYNAMDADPFQLIIARRDLVEGAHQYLDALRRYWAAIAEVNALRAGVALEQGGRDDDQP
jgi:cobalt-zinc-cadmium efflux system outer membrane protein